MKTYNVYFRSDLQWGTREFDADTPEQALELARRFIAETLIGLDLDFYEACGSPINEIEICDDEGVSLVIWLDEDLRLRLVARDLLSAAQKILDRWQNGDIGEAIHELAVAVDAANGSAQ
jgi:hypothetical protein